MHVKMADGSKVEIHEGANAYELAKKLTLTAPDQAITVRINGQLKDFDAKLKEGDKVEFLGFDDPAGKEVFWHTSAHVLAQAIMRLYPDAQPTIGPPIEHGFYYDFANLHISDKDFEAIEKEMVKIVKENFLTKREQFASKAEALAVFGKNPFKKELIEQIEENEGLTGYRQGEFFDLCRGPHMGSLGKIKALKLMRLSGAYWRGDSKNEMLTRVYAITFPDKQLLEEYLVQLEEAKKRDHKIIGPQLGLFTLKEEAPGMPFILPKGMIIWNELLQFIRDKLFKAGYVEIKTPSVMTRHLWEKSGHWYNYKENMFALQIEDRDFAVKPMNCPGCILYYQSDSHSYRELPFRIGEIGNVHRYEPSGSLSGLFRVRSFHQDDAHIFLMPDQIKEEILKILDLANEIYSTFGLSYHLELSTRPEENTIGTDEEWELATTALREALDSTGRPYRVNEGDGAFYGPKIDFHIRDALGRTWQCGTVQLDWALPDKFGLEYTSKEGSRLRPVLIHRALMGSVERFFGILIEHFAGKFPLWLSPHQVIVLTVADRHIERAKQIESALREKGFHATVDATGESIGKKVRNAQLNKINYILTIGDKEVENGLLSVRTRDGVVQGDVDLDTFMEKLEKERKTKCLM